MISRRAGSQSPLISACDADSNGRVHRTVEKEPQPAVCMFVFFAAIDGMLVFALEKKRVRDCIPLPQAVRITFFSPLSKVRLFWESPKSAFAIGIRFRRRFRYFSFASPSTALTFLHSQKHSFTNGMRPSGNSRTDGRPDSRQRSASSNGVTEMPPYLREWPSFWCWFRG